MKALVKSRAEPGMWLEDVPEPGYGIDDVLIRVLKTGICGTDVHIYNWDSWAQKTIKPGTVAGHEFVGRIVAVGSNVAGPQGRRSGQRRGPHRLRPLPQLPRRTPPPLRQHAGRGREPERRLCRTDRGSGAEHLALRPAGSARDLRDLRSAGERSPHRAVLRSRGRGRAHHRRRTDRRLRGRHGAEDRRALRGGDRHQRLPPRPRRQDGRDRGRQCQEPGPSRGDEGPRHDGRLRRRARDVGQCRRACAR